MRQSSIRTPTSWTGASYAVAWSASLARIGADGSKLGAGPVLDIAANFPSLAWTGDGWRPAWDAPGPLQTSFVELSDLVCP